MGYLFVFFAGVALGFYIGLSEDDRDQFIADMKAKFSSWRK